MNNLGFEIAHYLIECQDRNRSSPYILQKIKYIKGLSNRNRFIFVYATQIPETTRKALEADGVMHMSFEEFAAFIARLEVILRYAPIEEIDEAFSHYLSRPIDDYDVIFGNS